MLVTFLLPQSRNTLVDFQLETSFLDEALIAPSPTGIATAFSKHDRTMKARDV